MTQHTPRTDASIRLANAPCSWGSLEFEEVEGEEVGYQQMLDELVATGYTGTELGDWGYMPTDSGRLRAELRTRELTMVGAFVPVALRNREAHAQGKNYALKVAQLLDEVSDDQSPFIILSDDNGTEPIRTQHAGRILPGMSLSAEEWETFSRGAESIARAVRDRTGLPTVFHHHCGGFVETPSEIDRFLGLTNSEVIGLVLDTGHYAYGAGSDGCTKVQSALDRYGDRIWHVHFKDCNAGVAGQARENEWGYFEAVRHGVFCELGEGCVEFPDIVEQLRERSYDGWVVVEQDVLPGMGTPRESAERNREYLRQIGL